MKKQLQLTLEQQEEGVGVGIRDANPLCSQTSMCNFWHPQNYW